MEHILDLGKHNERLFDLFKKIAKGNSILFLGAGASIGEKRYLSKDIIDYYESFLGRNLNEPDITKFVDMLSADPSFERNHFDNEVYKMLDKYKVTDAHKILASIPWREIITTNYDLLVEKAFDEIEDTPYKASTIVPIREQKEYNYRESNSEIKYVKLNGCMYDKRKYPFAFSTDDFNLLNKFYKVVLNDLKNLSHEISFISMGYSFSDGFGQKLLEKFDSYNFRERRWIYNVDPFPNENALHYYSQKKICIVKCSFEEFFKKYRSWLDTQMASVVKRKKISFTNTQNTRIRVPHNLALNLENSISQLNSENQIAFIKDSDFYMGEEPNYDIIRRDVDVLKKQMFLDVKKSILEELNGNGNPFIPIFFLKGDFGIGKSTFALRLIKELTKDEELDLLAFEILDFLKLRKEDLVNLFAQTKAKNIALFCDELEVESSFKAMIELRRELSIEQFTDLNVFFIVPIRENILEKYKLQRSFKRSIEIKIKAEFSDDECSDLLTKLKQAGLINYRDANEKNDLLKTINSLYGNDSFISLLELVTNGRHINDLMSAYDELSADAQKAFLFTAFLHQFKLLMPVSWLRSIISKNWAEFVTNVVQAEGKGILIQERVNSFGTDPDLFFRTKHPIIAKALIGIIEPNIERQYKMFEKMFNAIEVGNSGSYLINNILKTLIRADYFSESQIDKLYDIAYSKLAEEPHFLLNYAINLQKRKSKRTLKRALDILIYAESLLQWRNHRFIHRRAVINFELAKLLYTERDDTFGFLSIYLNEAKELFNVKQLMDPFSPYSYIDFIKLLVWEMENFEFSEENMISQRIQIDELFELAQNTITDDIDKILEFKTRYLAERSDLYNKTDYKQYLEDMYTKIELRPYACILLFNYYEENSELYEDWDIYCEELVDEMFWFTENNDVVKFLAKYLGRRLHIPNNRIKFFQICKRHPFLEKEIPLRYYYFNFIADSYDLHFEQGREMLKQIKGKYNGLNPIFNYVWRDSEGEEVIFDAKVTKWFRTSFKAVKLKNYQQFIQLTKGDYRNLPIGEPVKVKLHFYLYGIKAEIIKDKY
jgi:hypothetical protein